MAYSKFSNPFSESYFLYSHDEFYDPRVETISDAKFK